MTKTKKNASPRYLKPTFCALLAALIVLLTFFVTIPLGPLTITLNCLPVAVGSVLLGPVYGAVLGVVFGLASFFKTVTGGGGLLMTTLLTLNPFLTFVMCLVPRVICGWLPGVLFKALPKSSEPKWLISSAISCGLTTLLNTVGFLGLMWAFFRDVDKLSSQPIDNIFLFIIALAGLNALVEFGINLVLGTAVCRALFAVTKNKI
jgi:uncharacterized membrane protein